MEKATKDNLKVQALTQRIATLVAQYEEQMADYRADATITINQLSEQAKALDEELTNLRNAASEPVEAPAPDEK